MDSITRNLISLSGILILALLVTAKIYDRCELADVLGQLSVPADQISTWVCIAEHESSLNTSAVGPANWDQSRDHGLFQINDKYWCSPPGSACGVSCRSLEDDDIVDDWKCAKRIFKAHRLQEGNGFKAWAVYGPHCSGDTSSYVAGCNQVSRSSWYKSSAKDSWDYSYRSELPPRYLPLHSFGYAGYAHYGLGPVGTVLQHRIFYKYPAYYYSGPFRRLLFTKR